MQVGKAGATFFGMNTDSLCEPTFADPLHIVAKVTGTSCDYLTKFDGTFKVNTDAAAQSGVPTFQKVCDPAGSCIQITGLYQVTSGQGAGTNWYPVTATYAGGESRYSGSWQILSKQTTDWSGATEGQCGGFYWGYDVQGCTAATGSSAGYAFGTQNTITGIRSTNDPSAESDATIASGDPDRYIKCTVTDTNGTDYGANTATFRESGGAVPALPNITLPAGAVMASSSCSLVSGNTTVGVDWLPKVSTTPAYQKQATDLPDTMDGSKALQLRKADGTVCTQGDTACAGWFTDTNKATDYQCYLGTHSVDLSECTTLAPSFEPGVTPDTALGDPKTGKAITNPTPTSDDAQTQNNPADQGKPCFPSGLSAFNPLQWVERPVQCVMTWAFIPKAGAMDDIQDEVADDVNKSSIGKAKTILAGLGLVNVSDGGCSGVPITFDMYSLHVKGSLLAACPGDPLQAVAATTHTILNATVISVGALAGLRYLAQVFGFSGLGKEVEQAREFARVTREKGQ